MVDLKTRKEKIAFLKNKWKLCDYSKRYYKISKKEKSIVISLWDYDYKTSNLPKNLKMKKKRKQTKKKIVEENIR